MRLDRLVRADIYRDGGSFEAVFIANGGALLTLSLRARAGDCPREYIALHECPLGDEAGAAPVAFGSPREQELLDALREWLARSDAELGDRRDDVLQVRRMVEEIPRRRPSPPIWPILPD